MQLLGFWNFFVFSNFFRSNLFIFEPKVEKIYRGVFSTHFVPLVSILASKIIEEWNNQFYKLWFLQATEAPHYSNSQNSIISSGYVNFYAKILLILYTPFENSTTRIAILNNNIMYLLGHATQQMNHYMERMKLAW